MPEDVGIRPAEAEIISCLPRVLQDIAQAAGLDAALAIAREMPGCRLEIPACRDILIEIRNRRIRQEYDGGMAVNEIAVRHRLTARHIWTILGRPDKDITPPVLPLFKDF